MYFAKCQESYVDISSETQTWTIRNREELYAMGEAVGQVSLMCSSSLDWPEDVTDNLDVIDVCNLIRGNRIREDDINKMLAERNK